MMVLYVYNTVYNLFYVAMTSVCAGLLYIQEVMMQTAAVPQQITTWEKQTALQPAPLQPTPPVHHTMYSLLFLRCLPPPPPPR